MQNAQSPLLRLPQEIKDRVYELVCGGRTFHVDEASTCVDQLSDSVFRDLYQVDSASSETAANWNILQDDGEVDPRWMGFCARYQRCCIMPTMGFLRSCRQVLAEASLAPYSANTFVFSEAACLKEFATSLQPAQGLAVRTVRLEMQGCGGPDDDVYEDIYAAAVEKSWAEVLAEDVAGRFPRLRHVDLYVEDAVVMEAESWMRCVLELRKLRLRSVEIAIHDSDDDADGNNPVRYRWTVAEKQEVAGYFSGIILGRIEPPACDGEGTMDVLPHWPYQQLELKRRGASGPTEEIFRQQPKLVSYFADSLDSKVFWGTFGKRNPR